MKSKEFINEGSFVDAIKRSGVLGGMQQRLAFQRRDSELAEKLFYEKFFNELDRYLRSKPNLTEFTDYHHFESILEAKIIKEAFTAGTVEFAAKSFILNMLKKEANVVTTLSPEQETELDSVITQFGNRYRTTKKLTRQLSDMLANQYWAIYNEERASSPEPAPAPPSAKALNSEPTDASWNAYKTQNADIIPSTGSGAGKPIPDKPTLITQNRTFEFDFNTDKWIDVTDASKPLQVTDVDTIKYLNAGYYKYYGIEHQI